MHHVSTCIISTSRRTLMNEKAVSFCICTYHDSSFDTFYPLNVVTPELRPGYRNVNILCTNHHRYSASVMSTRPRPRPRPRSKASKESATQVPSSQEASTSFAIAPGKVDDVVKEVVTEEVKKPEPVNPALAYFMMNKKNDARQKQRASAITKRK